MVNPISLDLISVNGDNLGRVVLTDHSLGVPGQSAGRPVSRDVDREMSELCAGIRAAVSSEGLEPSLDEIALRFAISKALMTADEDGVKIPIPVKETSAGVNGNPPEIPGAGSGVAEDQPVADWDTLLATDTEGGAADV